MEVTRIHDGLWRWSVTRDGLELASAYLEHGDAMLLVDPVIPAAVDDRARFERALARDRARLGGAVWVLLTRADEPRDADEVRLMTGGRQWTPGDPEPPGVTTIPVGEPGVAAIWSPGHRALMPGRAMTASSGALLPAPGVDGDALLALEPEVVIPSVGPMMG